MSIPTKCPDFSSRLWMEKMNYLVNQNLPRSGAFHALLCRLLGPLGPCAPGGELQGWGCGEHTAAGARPEPAPCSRGPAPRVGPRPSPRGEEGMAAAPAQVSFRASRLRDFKIEPAQPGKPRGSHGNLGSGVVSVTAVDRRERSEMAGLRASGSEGPCPGPGGRAARGSRTLGGGAGGGPGRLAPRAPATLLTRQSSRWLL